MKQMLNVAIFGLSFGLIDEIKAQVLRILPSNINVSFVNLAEQRIDVLFVNDVFFNTTSIQKTLVRVSKYLRLVKDPEHTGEIVDDTLFYPLTKLDHLSHWMAENILHKPVIRPVTAPRRLQAEIVPLNRLIRELFTPRNGFIQLQNQYGFVALVDTRTERVWLKPNSQALSLNANLGYTYATSQLVQDVQKMAQAQDLRIWLWKLLHQSSYLPLKEIHAQQYFKLEIWPQFDNNIQRRDLMKMAACFSYGAKLADVASSLDLPFERVQIFVARLEFLNMGKLIEAEQANFEINDQQDEQQSAIRGFFGRLRKKLGL